MTLSELMENRFRGDIRFRGMAYLKAERVAITRVTSENLFAVVRDGVEYETQLSRADGGLKMYCTCAQGAQPEATCKHLWATILAVDEAGYLPGPIRPGQVPAFVTEPETTEFGPIEWDDEEQLGDVFQPPVTHGAVRNSLQVQPQLRPWELALEEVRRGMEAQESPSKAAGRERQIFYEIDVDQSRQTGQLVLQTSQRQRRANGQWGKLKPLKLRAGRLDEPDLADDRRILAYLAGGMPERANWYAQQAEIQAAVYRYRVPVGLCELLLPMMCGTGRVRYLGGDERASQPLEWDSGEPYELTIEVGFHEEDDEWRLEGKLRRGEEVRRLSEAELLLPGGLVLFRTHVSRLCDFDAFDWTKLLGQGSSITIASGDEQEFVDRLLDMPSLPRLELPESLQLEEVRAAPTPYLTMRSPRSAAWRHERLFGEVSFGYLENLVRGTSTQWAIVQRSLGRCIIRDREREEVLWAQLQDAGFRRLLDARRGGHDVEISARDLGPAVRLLIAHGWQVQADGKKVRQPGELQFRIQSGIDWFELHGKVEFEGQTASLPELLSALSRGDSTVRLDDGSLGILPEEWARQYGLLAGLGISEDDHLRFAHNQVALLDALLATQPDTLYDDRFEQLREKFRSFQGIESVGEPKGFKGTLRGYQREGLGWLEFLQEFRLGGCLADDMGLGKTVQLLALLLDRPRTKTERTPSLVVVPKSLLFNWRQECERFTPTLKVLEYIGLERAPLRDQFAQSDIVLTTYGTLRRDIMTLKETRFDYVVLDEAQTIKNAGSQIAKASRLLQANHRLALSGTPIENHLGDLWSIFEFLNPGMLGRSSVFRTYAADSDDEKTRKLLSQGLRPFILRRTKRQVAAELPEKFEQTIYCDMRKEQRHLYAELRDHYRDSLLGLVKKQGLAKSKMHVLEALLRLRQAACHPALLDKALEEDSSAKLDVLCPHVEELLSEGHKALIFSQFTSMLAIVRKHFDARGIVYEYLDGQTRDRKKCVERFQNDADCGVFLISLKAGGLGLNLTAADYVFLLDPWWNPAVEAQAIDRAHRVGQTKKVFAYRLICRNTVEEKIASLQGKKKQLADAILEADSNLLKDLSTEDLEMLLS